MGVRLSSGTKTLELNLTPSADAPSAPGDTRTTQPVVFSNGNTCCAVGDALLTGPVCEKRDEEERSFLAHGCFPMHSAAAACAPDAPPPRPAPRLARSRQRRSCHPGLCLSAPSSQIHGGKRVSPTGWSRPGSTNGTRRRQCKGTPPRQSAHKRGCSAHWDLQQRAQR